MMDFMERHNKFFLSLLIALILFVSTTPVYANIIPIRDLEKLKLCFMDRLQKMPFYRR